MYFLLSNKPLSASVFSYKTFYVLSIPQQISKERSYNFMKSIKKKLIFFVTACLLLTTSVFAMSMTDYNEDVQPNACAKASATYCQANTFGIDQSVWCETDYKFNNPSTENDRGSNNGYGPRSVSGSPTAGVGYVQSSRASAWLDGPYTQAFASWS